MDKESIPRLAITLTIIGIISAIFLTFVYQWTVPYIEENEAIARQQALTEVLPGSERFEEREKDGITFHEGYDENDNFVGTALIASGPGFQGEIEVMVGADPNTEKILGINILNHQETPGLGARITEKEFKETFEEMPFGEYQVIQSTPQTSYEVEVIAGATVSSESVVEIVEKAVQDIKNIYGGGN